MLLTKAPEQSPSQMEAVAARPRRLSAEGLVVAACQLGMLAFIVVRVWNEAKAVAGNVRLPFQLDYEEGNILNALVRIAHGLTPYPSPHGFPNVLDPYGPAGYYLLAIPVKLFGVSFIWPRLVIVMCVVAICCFLGFTIARLTESPLTGAVFGLGYAATPIVESWIAVLRVDLLALALCTAGFYAFVSATSPGALAAKSPNDRPGPTWYVAPAVLFALALLVKHTFVAAPAACVLYLVTRRRWKSALRMGGLIVALALCVFLIFLAITRGAILTNLFFTHSDPFYLGGYLWRMGDMVFMCRTAAVIAAAYLVTQLLQKSFSAPLLWLLLSSATAITGGKLGSSWNHFLEWPAALFLCAGLGWEVIARWKPQNLALPTAVVVAALLSLEVSRQHGMPYDPATVRDCRQVYRFVELHPGDHVLSENVGALVLSGKTAWISNPFVYGQLVMHGAWQDDLIEPRLRSRWFDLVVTAEDYSRSPQAMKNGGERFSAAMLQQLAANYRVSRSFRCRDASVMWEPLGRE